MANSSPHELPSLGLDSHPGLPAALWWPQRDFRDALTFWLNPQESKFKQEQLTASPGQAGQWRDCCTYFSFPAAVYDFYVFN